MLAGFYCSPIVSAKTRKSPKEGPMKFRRVFLPHLVGPGSGKGIWRIVMRFAALTTMFLAIGAGLGLSQVFAKEIVNLPSSSLYPLTPGEQLQKVVADTNNAGKIIHLAPGIYKLKPNFDDGRLDLQKQKGRLHLQKGMDIVGENSYVDCRDENGNPTPDGIYDLVRNCNPNLPAGDDQFTVPGSESVIDGSDVMDLEDVEGTPPQQPNGLIQAGLDNTISRVTI